MTQEEQDGRRPDEATPADPFDDGDPSLSDLRWEDSVVFLIFWALAVVVFLQFFTRYVLNDSLGWTEEIARYLLIGVTFAGAVIAVRKNDHVAVEVLRRYLGPAARRVVTAFIDLLSIAFFATAAVICARLAQRTNQMMVSVDISKSLVYWVVFASFVAMALFAVLGAWRRWRSPDDEADDASLGSID